MELVEFKNLYKEFEDKEILKNINLTIPKGKIIGLLGKNGTGKTTLIKLINDLLTPSKRRSLNKWKKTKCRIKKSNCIFTRKNISR
jgi:ABC-2 type transport system ATP-binding protein